MSKKIIILIAALFVLILAVFYHLDKQNKIISQQLENIKSLSLANQDLSSEVKNLEALNIKVDQLTNSLDESVKEKNRYIEKYNNENYKAEILQKNLEELEFTLGVLEDAKPHYYQENENLFSIFGSDNSAENVLPHFYLHIDDSLTLSERINLLIKPFQNYMFKDMPIELIDIKTENGKKIAYIDLKDSETTNKTWAVNYMPGSAGAIMTMDSLIETFLQRNTELEDWIDGVYFSYYGNNEHMDSHDPGIFLNIHYREID